MYEEDKLAEAKHFLTEMSKSINNQQVFCHELSAFLSAARSVLQYALKEAKLKSRVMAWYDAQVSTHPEIKFFKKKRDISIHEERIVPNPNINIELSLNECIPSQSLSVKATDKDGKATGEFRTAPSPPSAKAQPATVSYSYTFPDWESEPKDVVTLCTKYITAIDVVVNDGIAKGFLTKPSY